MSIKDEYKAACDDALRLSDLSPPRWSRARELALRQIVATWADGRQEPHRLRWFRVRAEEYARYLKARLNASSCQKEASATLTTNDYGSPRGMLRWLELSRGYLNSPLFPKDCDKLPRMSHAK